MNFLLIFPALIYGWSRFGWVCLLGALGGFTLFFIIYVVTKGGLGEGDVKLIPSLGLITGISGIFHLIFLAGLLSLPISIVLYWIKKERRYELPFAPFLIGSLYLMLGLDRGALKFALSILNSFNNFRNFL